MLYRSDVGHGRRRATVIVLGHQHIIARTKFTDAPPVVTISLDKIGKGYGQEVIPDEGVATQQPQRG